MPCLLMLCDPTTSRYFYGLYVLTLYLIEMPFKAFANRADPDQAALIRAVDSRPKGSGFKPHRRHCVVSLSKTH